MSKQQLGNDYPDATERLDRGVLGLFSAAERILLVIISLLTMVAVALELSTFFEAGVSGLRICYCCLSTLR